MFLFLFTGVFFFYPTCDFSDSKRLIELDFLFSDSTFKLFFLCSLPQCFIAVGIDGGIVAIIAFAMKNLSNTRVMDESVND